MEAGRRRLDAGRDNRGMATPSPASFLDQLFDRAGRLLQPPPWVVEEMQRRLVLTLNHVLQQEPEAQARLKRQAGRPLVP